MVLKKVKDGSHRRKIILLMIHFQLQCLDFYLKIDTLSILLKSEVYEFGNLDLLHKAWVTIAKLGLW